MRHAAGTLVEREAPRPAWQSRVLVLLLFTVGGFLALGAFAGAASADEGNAALPVPAVSVDAVGSDAVQESTPVIRSATVGATQSVAATAEVTAQATADVTEPVSATAEAVARPVADTAEPVASPVTVVVESTPDTVAEVVDEVVDPIVDPITDASAEILPPVRPAPVVPAPASDAPTGDAATLGAGTPVAPASPAIVADPTADQATAAARGIGSTAIAAGTDRPTITPAGVPAPPAAPSAPVEAPSLPGTARANGGHTATGLSATLPSALALPALTSVVFTAPVETLLHGSNAEPSSSPD
jgi:hypothetical protein